MKVCGCCGAEYTNKHWGSKYCQKCRDGYTPWIVWKEHRTNRLDNMMGGARHRAKAKKLPFDIDKRYLEKLWDETKGRCALTGIPFDLTHSGEAGLPNKHAPSIDRIEPSLGYTKGNIRLVIFQMNMALGAYGVEAFEEMINAYMGSR